MNLSTWGPATVLVVVVVLIAVLAGAVVVITNPGTLDFEHYLNLLWKFAAAVAGLGVGRGLYLGQKR